MTTSHETRRTSGRRLATTLATVVLVSATLVGCMPQSEDSARDFARTLEDASAVESVSVGISTPLPFTVQASLTILLAPDVTGAALDELQELACSTKVNASISMELEYEFGDGARLTQEGVRKCGDNPFAFVDVLPVFAAHQSEFQSVTWRERDDDGEQLAVGITLIDDENAGLGAALADEVLAALPYDPVAEIASGSFDVTPGSVADARSIAQAVAGIANEVPVARASYDEGLFVQLAVDDAGSVEVARAYLEQLAPAILIRSVVDSTVDVTSGIPDQSSLDAERALKDAGLADKVSVSRYGLNVWASSSETIIEAADFLDSKGMGQVSVDYSLFDGDDVIATLKPSQSATALTAQQLAEATTLFDTLNDTGNLGVLYYTPRVLQVYLAEDVYDQKGPRDAFLKILRDQNLLDGHIPYVELNNREVPLD